MQKAKQRKEPTASEAASAFHRVVAQVAAETGDTEADVLVKCTGLLIIAINVKRQGNALVITKPSAAPAGTKITGLW